MIGQKLDGHGIDQGGDQGVAGRADDQLDPKERAFVAALGPAWGVPEALMNVLLDHLDRGKPLPQPNLKLLRTKPDAVITTAEALIAADGIIDSVEMELMEQVRELLGREP